MPTSVNNAGQQAGIAQARALRWLMQASPSTTQQDFLDVVSILGTYANINGGDGLSRAEALSGYVVAYDLINPYLSAASRSTITTRLNSNVFGLRGTALNTAGNQGVKVGGQWGYYAMAVSGNNTELNSRLGAIATSFQNVTTNDGYFADGQRYLNYTITNLPQVAHAYANVGGDATGSAQYTAAITELTKYSLNIMLPNGVSSTAHNSEEMGMGLAQLTRSITDTNIIAAVHWNLNRIGAGFPWSSYANTNNSGDQYPGADFIINTNWSVGAAQPNWSPTYLNKSISGANGTSNTTVFKNDWSTTSNYLSMMGGIDGASTAGYAHNDTGAIVLAANGFEVLVEPGYNRSTAFGDPVYPNAPGGSMPNTTGALEHNVLLARNTTTSVSLASTNYGQGTTATSQTNAGNTITTTGRLDSNERGSFKGVMDFSTLKATYGGSGATGQGTEERRSIGMVNETSTNNGYMVMTDSARSTRVSGVTNSDFALNLIGKSMTSNTAIITDSATLKEIRWSVNNYHGTTSSAGGLPLNPGDTGYINNRPAGSVYDLAQNGQVIAHIVASTTMDAIVQNTSWQVVNYAGFTQTQRFRIQTTNQSRTAFLTLFETGAFNDASKWEVTPLSGTDYAAAKVSPTPNIVPNPINWVDWHISQTSAAVLLTTAGLNVSIDSGALSSNGQYSYLRRNYATSALDSVMMSRGTFINSGGGGNTKLLLASQPLTMSLLYDTGVGGVTNTYKGTVSTDDLSANTTISFYNVGKNIASATLGGNALTFTNAPGVKTINIGSNSGDLVVTYNNPIAGVLSLDINSASFGRVMQGATPTLLTVPTLINAGNIAASYTAAANNNGIFGSPGSGTLYDTEGSQALITTNLVNNANGTATTGVKNFTYTVHNTTSNNDDAVLTLDATVIAQRSVTAASAPAKILVNTTTSIGLTTDSSVGNDNNNTRVNVSQTAAANGDGAQITGGTGTVFGGPGGIVTGGTRNLKFNTSGAKSGSIGVTVTSAEAGAVGDTVPYADTTINYATQVYQAASLSVTGGTSINISNLAADIDGGVGPQRAAARLKTMTLTGGANVMSFTLSAGVSGTVINQNSAVNASPSFGNALNGSYSATYSLGFEHADQSIVGTGPGDLSTFSIDVTGTVSTNQGSQTSTLASGTALAGFSGNSNFALNTNASFLAGVLNTQRTITTNWATGINAYSDVVSLSGLSPTPGSQTFVMQMNSALPLDSGMAAAGLIYLGWDNGSWVNAVTGNSTYSLIGTPVLASYNTYFSGTVGSHGAKSGNSFALNDWGIDTVANTVWAVLDHNSDFTLIVTSTPEPTSIMLLGAGSLLLTRRRRRA
ncbi:MAG: PEP-CTERM sorting domain-containing protein [Planctomycetes bacterium]|nr:PEP-CTERM sorting domain-containing protein [Planctomycetota bacterium]